MNKPILPGGKPPEQRIDEIVGPMDDEAAKRLAELRASHQATGRPPGLASVKLGAPGWVYATIQSPFQPAFPMELRARGYEPAPDTDDTIPEGVGAKRRTLGGALPRLVDEYALWRVPEAWYLETARQDAALRPREYSLDQLLGAEVESEEQRVARIEAELAEAKARMASRR